MPENSPTHVIFDDSIQEIRDDIHESIGRISEGKASRDSRVLTTVMRHINDLVGSTAFSQIWQRVPARSRLQFQINYGEIAGLVREFEITRGSNAEFRQRMSAALLLFRKNLEEFTNLIDLLIGDSAKEYLTRVDDIARTTNRYVETSVNNPELKSVYRRLEQAHSDADLLRAQLGTTQTELEIRDELVKSAEMQTRRMVSQIDHLDSMISELGAKVAAYSQTEDHLKGLIADANENKSAISKIRDEVQTLAADAADNVMAANYGTMAEQHRKKERFFRWAALVLFGISTIGAALIAWNVGWFATAVDENSSLEFWSSVIKKLLVAGGLAGIGFYFSRLASHHRKIEVWSSSLGVQLKTLESYLGGIKDEALKDSIREKFAGLTFGGPPQLHSSNVNSTGPDAKSLTEMVTAISAAIRP